MSNLKSVLLTLLAVPLGSCMTTLKDTEPAMPVGHNFAYELPHRESVNLVQAFDDGSTTYLQFTETSPGPIDIRPGSEDKTLTYTLEQRYAIVQGVYASLLVTVGDHSTTVINQAASAAPNVSATSPPAADLRMPPIDQSRSGTMSAVIAGENLHLPEARLSSADSMGVEARRGRAVAVGVPESIQTMHANLRVAGLKQEISTLEEKVRRLSAELAEAQRVGRGMSLYMRDVGSSPRVVLKFGDNSFETQVEDNLLDPLGTAARAANRIYLHGHTDAYVASETGTELAIRRAVEVRRLLISLNVEPERIRLFYRGAGNFVANNSTPEGKALNRRVEIELRKW
jgi:outer membrane protein OmpA-like peptidoglycan-associated protein